MPSLVMNQRNFSNQCGFRATNIRGPVATLPLSAAFLSAFLRFNQIAHHPDVKSSRARSAHQRLLLSTLHPRFRDFKRLDLLCRGVFCTLHRVRKRNKTGLHNGLNAAPSMHGGLPGSTTRHWQRRCGTHQRPHPQRPAKPDNQTALQFTLSTHYITRTAKHTSSSSSSA